MGLYGWKNDHIPPGREDPLRGDEWELAQGRHVVPHMGGRRLKILRDGSKLVHEVRIETTDLFRRSRLEPLNIQVPFVDFPLDIEAGPGDIVDLE